MIPDDPRRPSNWNLCRPSPLVFKPFFCTSDPESSVYIPILKTVVTNRMTQLW
ncbi:hypothetical protein C8J55DRAFT_528577 [Lentinula edodes]|uniref:Uncharacterized protein n=1 Tax=Lentinula lateritia TaxID=40482 RepID=A0A9W8ZS42_9AGAR|nr:hypothetical protein C8J55DRAFT_528577 [Lentinula edodes]